MTARAAAPHQAAATGAAAHASGVRASGLQDHAPPAIERATCGDRKVVVPKTVAPPGPS